MRQKGWNPPDWSNPATLDLAWPSQDLESSMALWLVSIFGGLPTLTEYTHDGLNMHNVEA